MKARDVKVGDWCTFLLDTDPDPRNPTTHHGQVIGRNVYVGGGHVTVVTANGARNLAAAHEVEIADPDPRVPQQPSQEAVDTNAGKDFERWCLLMDGLEAVEEPRALLQKEVRAALAKFHKAVPGYEVKLDINYRDEEISGLTVPTIDTVTARLQRYGL